MKSKKMFSLTASFFLIFAVFTAAISFVDVQPIGPQQSEIGLATVNKFVLEHLGVNMMWYNITDFLGKVAVVFALAFAFLGLVQLIKRKSLVKVDYQILLLGVFYAIVIMFYIFFEYAVINYRPVILDGNLEASYPSSHTVLTICIMSTAIMEFRRLLTDEKTLKTVLCVISVLILVVTVVGRMLSGVHWFTDIIGGILLSTSLVMLYSSSVKLISEKHKA